MKPYNPLEKENLGKSVAISLIKRRAHPLAGMNRFLGAGVYAIYYTGKFDLYAPIAAVNPSIEDLSLPIYVGKAVPTGGRKGNVDPDVSAKGASLFSRLDEHRKSIEQAENLKLEDFLCKHLIVDDIWIPLGESLLIGHYRPIWNSLIDGFGNHDPGKGRHLGARPIWDTLHPGRVWATRCSPSSLTVSQIRERVTSFWKSYQIPDSEV
jgi:hypothetical protein